MEQAVFSFFDQHIDVNKPLLIGYSGGPDSCCLLHLLLRWKKVPIHLVHIDHGWRDESSAEREAIQTLASSLNLPLHWITLSPKMFKGNLEDACRKARLAFFQQVAKEVSAQGILLGHHADDQVETVFKRFLEGATLLTLGGMAPLSRARSLKLFRPFLTIKKEAILEWLDAHGIAYFYDSTNKDVRYLRARMRQQIFPFLQESFGKSFDANISVLSEESLQLRDYFEQKLQPFVSECIESDWGLMITRWPEHFLECKYFIQKVLRQLAIPLSRKQIETLIKLIGAKTANKQLSTKDSQIFCDRGYGFFCPKPLTEVEGSMALEEGTGHFCNWKVTCVPAVSTSYKANHFIDAWRGKLQTILPKGKYTLSKADFGLRRVGVDGLNKEYRRYVSEKKVPNFFLRAIPVLISTDKIVEDFITGAACSTQSDQIIVTLVRMPHHSIRI